MRRWVVATFVATFVATAGSPVVALAAPTEPGELVNPLFEPVACENCHLYANADVQDDDPPYAPVRTWQGTLMANAARDPVFWAGVAVADQDAPGQTELCIRCHSPRAFLEDNAGATTIDALTPAQQQGVECTLCHRMMDDGITPPGNAMYTIDDVVVGTSVPRRGPWDFSDGVPQPPHSWINDPFTGSSRLCGTCHDVTTPIERVDDAGVGLGVNFNEQRTYSEWINSAYATPGDDFRSCNDCHMPEVPDMPGCQAHVNQFSHAEGGRRHDLVGANRFVIELLRQEYGSMGTNVISDAFFDLTIERLDEFLPTAATLEVVAPAEVDLTAGLDGLGVTVTNETGHKLPSGYSEGRVMWIEVLAEYAGQQIYSSGAWDQATGAIEADGQLRTYEAIGEDYADGTTFHLLRNNHWVVDSRIPPLGLVPDIQTDPVGDRYTLQPDGTWPNFDVHAYDFPAAPEIFDATPADPTDDLLTVTVRLRYLINSVEYIEFLGDAGEAAGEHVATLFDLAGGAPALTVVEQVVAIPIVGFGSVAGTSTGAATDDGDSAGTSDSGVASTGGLDDSTSSPGPGTLPSTAGPTDDGADTTGDAGGAGDDGGGCGCRTGGRGSLPWLLLAPVLLRRRRRR